MDVPFAEHTVNGIEFKLYTNALEVLNPENLDPAVIYFREIYLQLPPGEEDVYEFLGDYYTLKLGKLNMNTDDYKIEMYDEDAGDDDDVIADEIVPREFVETIINAIRIYVPNNVNTNNTNNNNNNNLHTTQYPNNGQRTNRNVPANATNAISTNNIENGTNMVNFHGEFGHGRFYTKNTFNKIKRHVYSGKKRNPYTQQNIESGNITRYTAKKAAQGGRRRIRKTKKRRVSKKKTQRRRR